MIINPQRNQIMKKMKKNEENDIDADCAEWKSQLVMQNSCISTKIFEDTCSIYSASEPAEIFMGSNRRCH